MEGKKKGLFLLIGMIGGVFAVLAGMYFFYVNFIGTKDELIEYWYTFENLLTEHTFWLFASIAILPAFILPVAPLLTLAGVWGKVHGVWMAFGYTSLAVVVNLTWTYWLASGPGHSLIKKLLSRTKFGLPEPDRESELEWALILRLVPGVPFIFTNYALGLIRMPFSRYFLVSTPILIVTSGGYVLTVAGMLGEQWGAFFLGLSVTVVMLLVGRIVFRKYGRNKQV